MSTTWVKTTSHRQRYLLEQTFQHSDLDVPQVWFRYSTHPCQLRQNAEFWEIPADPPDLVDALKKIKGLVVLKRPVPADERFKPWSST